MKSKLRNRIPWREKLEKPRREGFSVAHKGKRTVVKDFEQRLAVLR